MNRDSGMWQNLPARLMLLVAVVAIAYFTFAAVSNGLQTQRLRDDEAALRQEIKQLKEDNRLLTGLREYLSSDEYIEKVARQQLGLVKPGETVITVFSEGTLPPDEPVRSPAGRWWDAFIQH